MRGLLFGIATILIGIALFLREMLPIISGVADFGLFIAIAGFLIAAVSALSSIYKKDNNKN